MYISQGHPIAECCPKAKIPLISVLEGESCRVTHVLSALQLNTTHKAAQLVGDLLRVKSMRSRSDGV